MTSRFAFQAAASPADLMDELEKFIVFWLGPRRPEYGEPESALQSFPLPYPLKRLYAFAGRWPPGNKDYRNEPNVFSVQDSLRPFSEIRIEDGKVDFLVENQGCWVCATLPEGEDPPVWAIGDFEDTAPGEWKLVSESLSRFLVTFCLQELLFGSKHVVVDAHLDRLFESAGQSVDALWTDGPYVRSIDSHHFFLLNNTVLVGRLYGSFWFGANHDDGIRFLDSEQSEIMEINLLTPGGWWLKTRRDGSGKVDSLGGESWALFPAGTFDFEWLYDQIPSLVDGQSYEDEFVVFVHRSEQYSTTGQHVRDLALLRNLFEQALAKVESKSADFELALRHNPPFG